MSAAQVLTGACPRQPGAAQRRALDGGVPKRGFECSTRVAREGRVE
jgi:hypothetical protein